MPLSLVFKYLGAIEVIIIMYHMGSVTSLKTFAQHFKFKVVKVLHCCTILIESH